MKVLRTLRNYIFYCGIEKEEYNKIKKDAYVSNFILWRTLHCFLTGLFAVLYFVALFGNMIQSNRLFYLAALIYFAVATAVFFTLKKDSLVAQLLIYVTISLLFVFAAFITQNKPHYPSATFIILLILLPMFMIDKPYYMAFVLCTASVIFLVWMYRIKPYEVWEFDFINTVIYSIVGIFLNIIANSIRIKEFVLKQEISIQKDTDELTGLKNKAALTREINEYLSDSAKSSGMLFILDVDRFKSINDTYGHDVGDRVIHALGTYLDGFCSEGEIAGRFGGDEFIVFFKDTDDRDAASRIAAKMIAGVSDAVTLPDPENKVYISIGIAEYHGQETNYSEIFKKADTALYHAKADPEHRFCFYE